MIVDRLSVIFLLLFFFNDTATTEIYTLSLHDALPISFRAMPGRAYRADSGSAAARSGRSEEHTSELQSRVDYLVCRLLLEKKKHAPAHSTYTDTTQPHAPPQPSSPP